MRTPPLLALIVKFFTLLAKAFGAATGAARRRGRTFKFNPKVAKWTPQIREVQCEVGTDLPEAFILAIISVESEGDPKAHRPGAQFYGLTQVGRAVAKETRTSRKKMGKGGTAGAKEAIRAFCRWYVRYEARFQGAGFDRIAIGWKGGVGTLATYNKRVRAGKDHKAIQRWLDLSRWGTWKYVRKARAAHSIWSAPNPRTAPAVTVR